MEAEQDHILKALEERNWVVGGKAGAAARLGVKRTTLIDKMRKRELFREMAQGGLRSFAEVQHCFSVRCWRKTHSLEEYDERSCINHFWSLI